MTIVTIPKVVACMPAWNAEAFIEPVLCSLAAQTYPNLEILISDDASTDATAKICERFAVLHPNARFIRQRVNLGWVGNVNALLQAADGEYLCFAFHDDLVRPTYVERLVEALERKPRAVLAYSDMIRTVRRAGSVTCGGVHAYTDLDGVEDRLERGLHAARRQERSYVITLANRGLFRRSAARRIGGLRRHFGGEYAADWPWLLHMALLGEFIRVPEALVEKHYSEQTLSASWKRSFRQRLGALWSCLREIARAPLPAYEKFRVGAELLIAAARRQWWRACRSPREVNWRQR